MLSTRLVPGVTALCVAPAVADDLAWINPAGGSWHNAANWSPARVPGPADTALFTLPGAYTVTLGNDADAARVRQSGGDVTLQLGVHTLRCTWIEFANAPGTTPVLTLTGGTVGPSASQDFVSIDGTAGAPAGVRLVGASVSAFDVSASNVDISGTGVMHGVSRFENVSLAFSGAGSGFSSTALGASSHGTFSMRLENNAGAFGDVFSCNGHADVVIDGGSMSWISTDGIDRLEVRGGGSAHTDFGGVVGEMIVTGGGSEVGNIDADRAAIADGAAVLMSGYPFTADTLVTGAGSRLRTWGVFGHVSIEKAGRLEEDLGGLDIGGDVRVIGPDAEVVGSELWLYGGLEVENGATLQTGDIHMTDVGRLRVSGGSAVAAGVVDAMGAVLVEGGGSRLSASRIIASALLAAADGGRIAAPTIEIAGGRLAGNGVIEGDVGHAGFSVDPTPDAAALRIDGAYTQRNALCVYEASLGPNGRSDVLDVNAATLRGALHLGFVDFYEPRAGDTFEILRASSIIGRFDPALLKAPPMPPGLGAAVRYTPTAVTVAIVCRADLDGSGTLTLADFLTFQNLYTAGDLAADLDGSGTLTLADFTAFRNAYTSGCP